MSFDVDVIAILGSFVFSVAWLVRLESKVLYLEKHEEIYWGKLDKMQEKLDQISEILARLVGRSETK